MWVGCAVLGALALAGVWMALLAHLRVSKLAEMLNALAVNKHHFDGV